MSREFRGARYEAGLTTKEIAAKVRAEMKADPALRGFKVSVRYESFSGGSAIRVEVTAVPAGFKILTAPDEARRAGDNLTPEARALLDGISARFSAFNRDNSDPMTDYFDVNFYDGRATFSSEVLEAARSTVPSEAETRAAAEAEAAAVLARAAAAAARERTAAFARARAEVEAAKEALLAASRRLAEAEAAYARLNAGEDASKAGAA